MWHEVWHEIIRESYGWIWSLSVCWAYACVVYEVGMLLTEYLCKMMLSILFRYPEYLELFEFIRTIQ